MRYLKQGLTRKQIFFIIICKLFIWPRYSKFKKSIIRGQSIIFAYKYNIKL